MHARFHYVLLHCKGQAVFFLRERTLLFCIRDRVFRHVGVSSVLIRFGGQKRVGIYGILARRVGLDGVFDMLHVYRAGLSVGVFI